jgi:hypothetical protein
MWLRDEIIMQELVLDLIKNPIKIKQQKNK